MITLYHSKDTRSLRCLWLLEELELAHELELVAYPARLKQPQYLEVNPNGTVPFLVDGKTQMRESCAILLYLASKYGNGRAQVSIDSPSYGEMLDWTFYGETALAAPLATALRYSMFLPREQRVPAVAQDYQDQMLQRLPIIDKALGNSSFLCGDELTVADISIGYGLLLGEMFGLAVHYPANLVSYLQRLKERPAFQRARSVGA